ncbi:MAG: hypothetical protein AAF098_13480 [Pseudomonadota bacterium]
MAKLPTPRDPTLEAMKVEVELALNHPPRGHLGASMIGDKCMRKLWYSFRWVSLTNFEFTTLSRFEDGHLSENVMAQRLRMVRELDLHTHAEGGEQFRFTDFGGHFAGSADGFVRGLLQAPKTPHIWEHKCVNEKKFAKLLKLKTEKGEKQALLEWDGIYYAQAQAYMHYFNMTRHYLTCATPGTRDVTSVRTEYNASYALSLVSKAQAIIASSEPPTRITEKKDDWRCNFCGYKEQCHFGMLASENCRTCRFSQPVDGGWYCHHHKKMLDHERQRDGCKRFLPIEGLSTLTEEVAA